MIPYSERSSSGKTTEDERETKVQGADALQPPSKNVLNIYTLNGGK